MPKRYLPFHLKGRRGKGYFRLLFTSLTVFNIISSYRSLFFFFFPSFFPFENLVSKIKAIEKFKVLSIFRVTCSGVITVLSAKVMVLSCYLHQSACHHSSYNCFYDYYGLAVRLPPCELSTKFYPRFHGRLVDFFFFIF